MKVQPKVFKHAACIIVTRHDGVDVIDPTTGHWRTFPSMRTAKWSASVFSRLAREFGHDVASNDQIDNIINQSVKE